MSDTKARRQWLLTVQSAYVLPLARGIYLLIALGCLVTVVGGVLFVLFVQASASVEPSLEPLPPPYQGTETAVQLPERDVDISLVERRLNAPSNVRFVVSKGRFSEPVAKDTVLGYFQATTPNELAPFPDGISILGGRDADLFDRVRGTGRQQIGLAPRASLVDEIAQTLQEIEETQTRTFEIRVIARDQYGIVSAPTDLSFKLQFEPPAAEVETETASTQEATELQKIAREIAQALEPKVNPAHFSAYRTAMEAPGRCGAKGDDASFLSNYRRAFDNAKPRLTTTNVAAFYEGLCEAWKRVLAQEAAMRQEAQEQQSVARRTAEQARARVQAINAERLAEHQAKVLGAKAQTGLALSVMGGALAIFLSVALVLAFLAIEGHSRAMRAAAEAMVRLAERQDAPLPPPAGEET